jgi:hypothetical protein
VGAVSLLGTNGSTGEKVREEGLVCSRERPTSKYDRANSAHSFIVGDMDVMASRILLDGHFRNYGDTHSGAHHAYETTELAAFKNNLGKKVSAIASGDGGLAKAVAVAEQKEWFGAEVLQGKRTALSESVVPREGGEEALSEQRSGFEFVAPDGKSQDGHVNRTRAKPVKKDRRNFFCDTEQGLRKLARERSEARGEEIRSNSRDDADADWSANGAFALNNVASGGFELAEN